MYLFPIDEDILNLTGKLIIKKTIHTEFLLKLKSFQNSFIIAFYKLPLGLAPAYKRDIERKFNVYSQNPPGSKKNIFLCLHCL